MALFTGRTAHISKPRNEVYERIANIGAYQQYLDRLPDDKKAKIGDVKFTDDAIILQAPAVGEITLQAVERQEPSKMVLEALNAPVSMKVIVNIEDKGDSESAIIPTIDVDIPPLARPFVAPQLQKAADQMGGLLEQLFSYA